MRPPLIILAGGKGIRLGALTRDTPKPMIDIFGKPFLYWLIQHYKQQGFEDIVISTGYKSEVIENYDWPWGLEFIRDEGYLPLTNFYSYWETSWVVNGDTWLPDPLPYAESPCIVVCNDVDAGACRPGSGKVKVYPAPIFYDIGTPEGLERFKVYFKTQLDAVSQPATLGAVNLNIPAKKENV